MGGGEKETGERERGRDGERVRMRQGEKGRGEEVRQVHEHEVREEYGAMCSTGGATCSTASTTPLLGSAAHRRRLQPPGPSTMDPEPSAERSFTSCSTTTAVQRLQQRCAQAGAPA